MGFPGGSVGRNPLANTGDAGSTPMREDAARWRTARPVHAAEPVLVSPCSATTEPTSREHRGLRALGPEPHKGRHRNGEPARPN